MSDEKLGINPLTAAEAEAEAGPVEIHPQTPFTAIAVVHHRHGGGPWAPACVACEIERLRATVKELEKANDDLKAWTEPPEKP